MDTVVDGRSVKLDLEDAFLDPEEEEYKRQQTEREQIERQRADQKPDEPPEPVLAFYLVLHFNRGHYEDYWQSEPMTEADVNQVMKSIQQNSYQRFLKIDDTLINLPLVTHVDKHRV